MDYNAKVSSILSIYNIDTKTKSKVIADILSESGFNSGDNSKWVNKIKQITANEELKILDKERIEASLEETSKCSICDKQGELVTLMRNRPAFYCENHRILNPLSIEQMEAVGFKYQPTIPKKEDE